MPEFVARVATNAGEVTERSYVHENEASLRRELEGQDLLILDLKQQSALSLGKAFNFRRRISMREFLLFNQELSALIRAGLPIVDILDILLERRKNETFKVALMDIRDRVRGGESLSEAFGAQGDMFPPLYSSSLASGEQSGELPAVLRRFIDYTQKVLELKGKVVQALIYPMVLFTLSLALIALMIFYIIPKFEEFLTGFNAELPILTQTILGIATFCSENWILILLSVVGSAFALWAWNRTPAGKLFFDKLSMQLPLIGSVMSDYAQNRFTRTLATLQAGGIPLVTALELSARAVGSPVYERELIQVADKVREGQSLWESLDETGLMSDIAVQMVKVGESTGALDEMLNNASEFTDREIDSRLARIITLVEPVMLIFMAFIVGTMLLSIYLPMIRLYGSAGTA